MSEYLIGFLAFPALALAAYVVVLTIRAVIRWWPRRPPLVIHDEKFRVANAAAILTARRVASVRLPGGVLLVWRSLVPWGTEVNRIKRAIWEVQREASAPEGSGS